MIHFLIIFFIKNKKYFNINKIVLNYKFIIKIICNYKFKINDFKLISLYFLILEYLTENKLKNCLILKKSTVLLKLKKHDIIGCYLLLKDNNFIFKFFNNLIFKIFLKNNIKSLDQMNIFLRINNIVFVSFLEKFLNYLNIKVNLKVSLIFKNKIEKFYFLKLFKFIYR